MINLLDYYFDIEVHAALDRNNTPLLQLIPGYLYSVCPHSSTYCLAFLHSHADTITTKPSRRGLDKCVFISFNFFFLIQIPLLYVLISM